MNGTASASARSGWLGAWPGAVLLVLSACAAPAAPVTSADAPDADAEVLDNPPDSAADQPDVATNCDGVVCAGACLPSCPLQASRVPEWACRCADLTPVPVGQGLPLGKRLGLSADVPGAGSDQAKAYRTFFFDRLKALGVQVLRPHFLWTQVEPAQGQFSWAATDAAVDALVAHDMKTIGLLGYGNPWASVKGAELGDAYYPPDDPQTFAAFAGAVAGRYAGKVSAWEVWNEQNAGYRFWKGGPTASGDPKAYGLLLQATAAAIRKANPKAQVGYGGLFYLPQVILGAEAFAEASLAAVPGLGASFDAFAWHPYAVYPPIKPPEFASDGPGLQNFPVDATARRLRDLLQAKGAGAKALWVTELGWPTEAAISELDHARYLVRSWVLAASEGVEVLCWYTFMDHPPDSASIIWEQAFGLYRWDGDATDGTLPQPKPAAIAHEALAHWLGPLGNAGDERPRTTARWQFAFADKDLVAHVAWDETVVADQTVPAEFFARPGRNYRIALATAVPVAEASLPQIVPDAEGRVRFQVGRTPVYILERACAGTCP